MLKLFQKCPQLKRKTNLVYVSTLYFSPDVFRMLNAERHARSSRSAVLMLEIVGISPSLLTTKNQNLTFLNRSSVRNNSEHFRNSVTCCTSQLVSF
jgi:hypothetical protein